MIPLSIVALALASSCAAVQDEEAPPPQGSPGREPVVLPYVLTPVPEPEVCTVASVRVDGTVVAARDVLVEGTANDLAPWIAWLAERGGELGEGTVPRLLLRAEANATFGRCAALFAAADGWETSFAAGDARVIDLDPDVGGPAVTTEPRAALPLPRARKADEPRFAVRLHVAEEGRKLMRTRGEEEPWDGSGRYRWDQKTRRVVFALGAAELDGYTAFAQRLQGMRGQLADAFVSISAGPGVTTVEVLLAVDALRGAGAGRVAWTPWEPPE